MKVEIFDKIGKPLKSRSVSTGEIIPAAEHKAKVSEPIFRYDNGEGFLALSTIKFNCYKLKNAETGELLDLSTI